MKTSETVIGPCYIGYDWRDEAFCGPNPPQIVIWALGYGYIATIEGMVGPWCEDSKQAALDAADLYLLDPPIGNRLVGPK